MEATRKIEEEQLAMARSKIITVSGYHHEELSRGRRLVDFDVSYGVLTARASRRRRAGKNESGCGESSKSSSASRTRRQKGQPSNS